MPVFNTFPCIHMHSVMQEFDYQKLRTRHKAHDYWKYKGDKWIIHIIPYKREIGKWKTRRRHIWNNYKGIHPSEIQLLGLLIPTKSNISLRRSEIQSSETIDAHICLFWFDGNFISSGSCRARYITGRRWSSNKASSAGIANCFLCSTLYSIHRWYLQPVNTISVGSSVDGHWYQLCCPCWHCFEGAVYLNFYTCSLFVPISMALTD